MRKGFVPLWILVLVLLALLFAPIPYLYGPVICAEPLVYPGTYKPCPKEGDIGFGPSIAKRIWWMITKPEAESTEERNKPYDVEGKPCGGFAGETGELACPQGYKCQYPKPVFPDAQGQCVKM